MFGHASYIGILEKVLTPPAIKPSRDFVANSSMDSIQGVLERLSCRTPVGFREAFSAMFDLAVVIHTGYIAHPNLSVGQDDDSRASIAIVNKPSICVLHFPFPLDRIWQENLAARFGSSMEGIGAVTSWNCVRPRIGPTKSFTRLPDSRGLPGHKW